MKRKRHGGAFAALVVFALIAAVLVTSSVRQNLQVRSFFNGFLQAVKDRDRNAVQEYYNMQTLHPDYLGGLLHFDLLGWTITRVGGQPWPLDQHNRYVEARATLYFDLPDELAKKKTVHSKYGQCAEVPVRLKFHYDGDLDRWSLPPPDPKSKTNWLLPADSIDELGEAVFGKREDQGVGVPSEMPTTESPDAE